MTDLANDMQAFYDFCKGAGHYAITEAIDRWRTMQTPGRLAVQESRPRPEHPGPEDAPGDSQ